MLLKLPKELLGVASGLRTSSRPNELLDAVPVLPEFHQALQELVMFFVSPLAFVEFSISTLLEESPRIIRWALKLVVTFHRVERLEEGK